MTDMPPYLAVKDEEKNSGQEDSDTSSDSDDWDLPLCFDKPRHTEPIKGAERVEHSWRVKEKYKTHCVALVLCLNVGVDPPDVVKTQPCARLECWIDPNSLSPSKALESIGHALQAQYERWQPRARYRQSLDPTSDEVKKLCCSLRRNAKDERVLFHYNGHGVPKPTAQGEIWVFNRTYTQYIPLSMYDLQTWMGAPSLYVYDCSNAGVIIDNFKLFAEQHERDYEMQMKGSKEGSPAVGGAAGGGGGGGAVSYKNCIQLGACAAGQALPMNPELPADLFTACLTTPVKCAMRWFVQRVRTRVAPSDVHDLIDKIPGQVTDRRTMLGELNWIFTAITDTIAWNSLPSELFQQLFRADLLTASLCRNFLLADRIMRSYNCTPVSSPALPSLARHPLWAAWEQTLDLALAQLPALLARDRDDHYRHSPFFRDQLTAFQVWLELGAGGVQQLEPGEGEGEAADERWSSRWGVARPPPDQLPMVLQVLLSTLHRVRALHLLCRFLALGGWAVRAVLSVGIFPYMLKLLQASAHDLRASMVYIWANIIAQDPSCQVDLVNAKGHKYFLSVMQDQTVDSEHRTMAAYVLAGIVDQYPAGQEAALQGSMISVCLEGVCEARQAPALAQWACVGLGRLWRAHDAARWAGVRDLAHEKLCPLLRHSLPELRAAAAFALGTFVAAGEPRPRTDHANALDHQVALELARRLPLDFSPLVRLEILAALQWLVLIFEQHFIAVYIQERNRRSDKSTRSRHDSREPLDACVDRGQDVLAPAARSPVSHHTHPHPHHHHHPHSHPHVRSAAAPLALPAIGFGSVYMKLYNSLSSMAREPQPQVAQMAGDIIAYIANQVDNVVWIDPEASASRTSSGNSASLPPSPNTRGEPLAEQPRTLPHARRKHGLPHTISEDSVTVTIAGRDRDSASSTSSQPSKRPIVSTSYVEWAAAAFVRRAGARVRPDVESAAHLARQWRARRDRGLRAAAGGLRAAPPPRLETQAFHARCPLPAAALAFHPYERHVAVAARDTFGVWEWGGGGGGGGGQRVAAGGWRRAWGRISAAAYLDAGGGGRALLALASTSGQLALFRAPLSPAPAPAGAAPPPETPLVAAWRALPVRVASLARPPDAHPIYSLAQLVTEQFAAAADSRDTAARRHDLLGGESGPCAGGGGGGGGGGGAESAWRASPPATLVRWCRWRRSLALAGHAPCVRLWDADTELLHCDIPTECDAAATSLWRSSHRAGGDGGGGGGGSASLVVVGFADGSVRAWDERAPSEGPLLTLPPHAAPVLCAAPRDDRRLLLTGCMNGELRLYDSRKLSAPTGVVRAPGPLAAVDLHPLCDLIACGSVNQCISMYDLNGAPLNTIKFHEGFMGARIGPVSCLAFHPLRCAMGVGSKDSTVSVYVSEARR